MHLAHAPEFTLQEQEGAERTQLSALDDLHGSIRSPSTTLRIELADYEARRRAIDDCCSIGLPRLISSRIVTRETDEGFSSAVVASVARWIGRLDVRVAFQLDLLLRNGILTYEQVSLGL